MLFGVTKMLNSVSLHYSTGCQSSLAARKLSNEKMNGETSTESLPKGWLQVKVKGTLPPSRSAY